jgi:hypothetical protein
MPKKPCKDNQLRNPSTGRCVNKDGKIGKEILKKISETKPLLKTPPKKSPKTPPKKSPKKSPKNPPKKKSPKTPPKKYPKKCDVYEIWNPSTGRCVKKEGKVGKEILKNIEKKEKEDKEKEEEKMLNKIINTKWTYLSVPVIVSEHFSAKYNKHIYIFGDYHDRNIRCPIGSNKENTVYFLDLLKSFTILKNSDNTPKVIDYFFELAFKNKMRPFIKPFGEDYLRDVNELFDNCLQLKKDLCQYKNVRMHYSDVRKIKEIKPFYELRYYFNNLIKYYNTREEIYKENLEQTQIKKNDIINNLSDLSDKGIDYLIYISKSNKQLDNLEFPDLKPLIKTYSENKMRVLFKNFNIDKVKNIFSLGDEMIKGNFPNKKEIDMIETFYKQLLDLKAYLMDIYLFARMFRKFKKTETHSEPPTNIVIYVGSWHAENYRKLLDLLGFTSKLSNLSKNKGKDFQCVNISKFVQPFFSGHELKPNKVYL